ncbi:transporter [Pseudomonas sp. Irchel s3b5]|uniref:SphA family protein n=1 Tax=Pseudomonas sp. Irchel s3b5 TaxID=2009077 RepID=UPI000BA3EF04|nr:transporter [Pseudomonas sp. Irchel s3b5]
MSAQKNVVLSAVFVTVALAQSNALALENGTSGYPRGIVTVMSGAVGAPGETHVYSYNTHTDIDSIRDGKGNKVFPKAKGSVNAHALRVVHTLKDAPTLFGGNISLQMAVPYVDGSVDIPVLGSFMKDSSSGFGDPLFGAIVSWASPTYLHNVEVDLIAPWGKYDERSLINPGANNSAAYLAYCFTWFPLQYLEVSSKISVNYSFENHATDYQSGVQVVADYGLNYRLGQNWLAGIGGFVSSQLNDDQLNGQDVGNRSRSAKVGPQVGYASRDWGVFAAYQKDVYARNSPSGDTMMVNGFIKF